MFFDYECTQYAIEKIVQKEHALYTWYATPFAGVAMATQAKIEGRGHPLLRAMPVLVRTAMVECRAHVAIGLRGRRVLLDTEQKLTRMSERKEGRR